jgi:hypothetical protein
MRKLCFFFLCGLQDFSTVIITKVNVSLCELPPVHRNIFINLLSELWASSSTIGCAHCKVTKSVTLNLNNTFVFRKTFNDAVLTTALIIFGTDVLAWLCTVKCKALGTQPLRPAFPLKVWVKPRKEWVVTNSASDDTWTVCMPSSLRKFAQWISASNSTRGTYAAL